MKKPEGEFGKRISFKQQMKDAVQEKFVILVILLLGAMIIILLTGCSKDKYDPSAYVVKYCQENALSKNMSYSGFELIKENETIMEAKCILNNYIQIKK